MAKEQKVGKAAAAAAGVIAVAAVGGLSWGLLTIAIPLAVITQFYDNK